MKLCVLCTAFLMVKAQSEESIPETVRGLSWQSTDSLSLEELELLKKLGEPLLEGRDVSTALSAWFEGRKAVLQHDDRKAAEIWKKGAASLDPAPSFLPIPERELPEDADFTFVDRFKFPGMTEEEFGYIISWKVDDLKQYGVLFAAASREQLGRVGPNAKLPLILYLHGSAYGVPSYSLPRLLRLMRNGYAVFAPSLRGEDLFASFSPLPESMREFSNLKSEGEIENYDGELRDVVSASIALRKIPLIKKESYAVYGYSYGGGLALLTASVDRDVACVVSYDGWFLNPFRFYRDRLMRGANNWRSWEYFCDQPVEKQLEGMMKRSATHRAADIQCPLLLFIGGAYAGSVYHQSHADFVKQLQKHNKSFVYDIVKGGQHNFVLYPDSAPAKYAYPKQMKFLSEHFPPREK